MKKTFLLFTLISLLFVSCSKDNNPDLEIKNIFIDTSWTADDDIASLIYGKGATTTIEFITETECQEIGYRPNSVFSKTIVEKGTYTYKGKTVTWTVGESSITGTASGSILSTNMNTMAGEKRIYKKNP